MAKEIIQFCYFNDKPWYGARLALSILGKHAPDYEFIECNPKSVVDAKGQKVILFSILSAREYHTIFKVMDNIKQPYFSKDRGGYSPVVVCGGAACYQPEPIADFIDVFCVGDGEEFLAGLQECLKEKTKEGIIASLSLLPGAYVPAKRAIHYDSTRFFVDNIERDSSFIIPNVTYLWYPPPFVKNEAKEIELARGCKGSCFFCSISWAYPYRERNKEDSESFLTDNKTSFFAPNSGGISYYQDIVSKKGGGSKGDIRVIDFLRLPEPIKGDYKGQRFTFGIEGITERLRRIVGKPISNSDLEEMQKKLVRGEANHQQLYFIRCIPSEAKQDYDYFLSWVMSNKPIWREAKLATEIQLTPLTKQAHTPLSYFSHYYNDYSEDFSLSLVDICRKDKKRDESSNLYVTPSRRKASWLIDNLVGCSGRNGVKFLWAIHKGMFDNLGADSRIGGGYYTVFKTAQEAGLNPEVILGDWDFDAILPWSHIVPGGEGKHKRMLKAANYLARQLRGESQNNSERTLTHEAI